MEKIKIKNLTISENSPPILIAEIGINHGPTIKIAKKMAKLAVENGANIIKHQCHIIDDEMSKEANSFKISYVNKSIYEIMKDCSLSEKNELELKHYVEKTLKSVFISTPFSRKAADFLQKIKVPAFKIGSGECNNFPLIDHISKFKNQ